MNGTRAAVIRMIETTFPADRVLCTRMTGICTGAEMIAALRAGGRDALNWAADGFRAARNMLGHEAEDGEAGDRDAEGHELDPSFVRALVEERAAETAPGRPMFLRDDGAVVTAAELLREIDAGTPTARDYAAALVAGFLSMLRAEAEDDEDDAAPGTRPE